MILLTILLGIYAIGYVLCVQKGLDVPDVPHTTAFLVALATICLCWPLFLLRAIMVMVLK